VHGGVCALAVLGIMISGPADYARGEATLLDFISETQSPAEDIAAESMLEPESPLEGDQALQQPMVESDVPAMAPYDDSAIEEFGVGPEDQPQQMGAGPVSWISGPYLRYGVDFVVGEGVLEGGQKLGWGINGGFRQPFAPGLAPGRMFFDLGGGYLSAVGNTTRQLPGTGTLIAGGTRRVEEAFTVNLTEVKRAGVNVALGWYWGDVVDSRGNDPRLRFATRFGGRYGSVRARYLQTENPLPADVSSVEVLPYLNTDTFGGLLLGTEAILLNRTYGTCNVQWTADVEFANDWMEFAGFDSGSLGTASLMTGLMLSR
jgi:hypothetical protein